jgi:uncharacterized damage-inducible protein DinB
MASLEHFQQLFAYHNWANRRVMEAMAPEDNSNRDQVVRLFAHMLGAQNVWLLRMTGGNLTGVEVWPQATFEECLAREAEYEHVWSSFLSNLDEADLKREITYTTSRGDSFTNTFEDIITHMFNHATYHRGQIATKIKEGGGTPPVTDYIAFVRA